MWPPFCLTTSCKRTLALVTTQVFRKRAAQLHYVSFGGLQRRPENVAQLRSHIVKLCRALSDDLCCDECKGSFVRGCEAKRWSHWTCTSIGTIFQLMRINSVPDVKCFCNNKNVLLAQSMVWHFVRHPVHLTHCGRVTQICVFTILLCKTDDANLRF